MAHPMFPVPTAAQQQQLGLQVGDWIGDGSFKSVYSGQHNNPFLQVAVAVGGAQDMQTEAEALRRMSSVPSHPNVISLLNELVVVPRTILILTFAGDQDLFDYMTGAGVLLDAQLRPMGAQLVSGLRHMHRMGLCHGDIKLDNVVIDPAGSSLKYVDFNQGILAVPQPAPQLPVLAYPPTQGVRGSRSYAAPEVHAGQAYEPCKADVWSLGVVLFALCSRFFPFDEATPNDWRFPVAQAVQATPNQSTVRALYAQYPNYSLDQVHQQLIDLMDAMLSIDPQVRTSLDSVAASAWLEPVAAQVHAHDRVLPLDPAMWRLRALSRWRRLAPFARTVQRCARSFLDMYCTDVRYRPGHSGMHEVAASFYENAAVLDAMEEEEGSSPGPTRGGGAAAVYRSLGAHAVQRKVTPEMYRALAAKVLLERMPTGEDLKPPPLMRQLAYRP